MPTLAYGVGTKLNAGGGDHVHEGGGDHVHEGVPTDIQTQLDSKISVTGGTIGINPLTNETTYSWTDGTIIMWDDTNKKWVTTQLAYVQIPLPIAVPGAHAATPHGATLTWTGTQIAWQSEKYGLTELGTIHDPNHPLGYQIGNKSVNLHADSRIGNIDIKRNLLPNRTGYNHNQFLKYGPGTLEDPGELVWEDPIPPGTSSVNNHFLRFNSSTGLEWIDPAGIPPIANNLVPQRPAVLPTIPTVLANLTGGMAWCSLNSLTNINLHSSAKVDDTSILDNLVPSTPTNGGSGNVLTYTLLNGSGTVSWEPITPATQQGGSTVTYGGVGSVAIPDISSAASGSFLEVVPYNGVNELIVSGPCYFAGRPSDNSNTNMTASSGPTSFTQFTALTAFTGGNSSSGVSWSSGSVTLSTAGVYSVHYGLNVNSANCKIKRCIAQLRNGTTVLANSKWSSEVNGATPLHFYPSHGSWMGTLAANSSLQLWYQIAVVDTTGSTRILEYSTSTYGEYGGTYLYGHKIA